MQSKDCLPSSHGAEPVQKSVDVNSIEDWVPVQARQRISTVQAWNIIRREFCAALYARGVCPIQCERCREQIVDLFRLESATSPAALLTWLAKDHSAKWIEKLIAEEKAGDFPTQETAQAQMTDTELYHGLFLKGEHTDLYKELLKFYGYSE
jgi:hypothetical protein